MLAFGVGERLTIQRDVDREIEQPIDTDGTLFLVTDPHLDSRSRRLASLPPVRHTDDKPALLHRRHVAQKAVRLLDRQCLRLKQRARGQPLVDERAALRGRSNRGEQLGQLRAIPFARVLLECLGERQMLDRRLR